MTDNEIIKGLKCLSGDKISCKDCAFSRLKGHGYACEKNVANAALDLINRQMEGKVRAEAIKELAGLIVSDYYLAGIVKKITGGGDAE